MTLRLPAILEDLNGRRRGPWRWNPAAAIVVALAGIILSGVPADANSRYAAIVMDAVSGEVLHRENADRRLHPASLTKMMTLYMTFKALDERSLTLDQRIVISRIAAGQTPSRLGLPAGSTIRVEDAIYALVTKSANDIATALAEEIAGTEYRFALRMTEEARRLGMAKTTFRNASGLPHRRQVSTARDMALLSQALIRRYPQYYHYFSEESWTFNGRTYRNHNELMRGYDGMDGLKTGYIRSSGFNLAASAERGRLRLIAVVFGGRTAHRRNIAVSRLLDEAFASRRGRYLVARGSAPFYPPLPTRRPAAPGSPIIVATATPAAAAPLPPRRPSKNGGEATLAQRIGTFPVAARPAPVSAVVTTPTAAGADTVQVADVTVRGDIGSRPGLPSKVWGIQVGAFFDAADSQRAIDTAKIRVPDLLVSAPRMVMPVETSQGRMFRARIMGLDEDAAAAACDRLEAAGSDCLPLPPNGNF